MSQSSDPTAQKRPEFTELGNAERLAAANRERLRYVPAWNTWLAWDGKRWRRDSGAGQEAAKEVVRALYGEAETLARQAAGGDEPARLQLERVTKWAKSSASAKAIDATERLARGEPGIKADAPSFDAQPWLLNVDNGTLDLRTGVLKAHDPADMLTVVAPVSFRAEASCPQWEGFLARVLPDADVRRYLQRFLGYALTGDVGEQVLPVMLGEGANGKSTCLNTVQAILGEYALQGAPDFLLAKERGGDELGRRQRAGLMGKRFVVCQEIDEGRYLNESMVKQLTGGERITAARLYENEVEFSPTHKIVMAANHRPRVRGQDHAIWRRLAVIPFAVTIPDGERDAGLPGKLLAERDGILAWMVRGCLEWQQHGLGYPSAVKAATGNYRDDEDTFADFLEANTERAEAEAVSCGELHQRLEQWCKLTGEPPMSKRAMGDALRRFGYQRTKAAGDRSFQGLRLKPVPA